MISSLTLRPSM
jgi:hypothetical protein